MLPKKTKRKGHTESNVFKDKKLQCINYLLKLGTILEKFGFILGFLKLSGYEIETESVEEI